MWAQVVAIQAQRAFHLGGGQLGKGHEQRQIEFGVASHRGLAQGASQPAVDGRGLHIAQHGRRVAAERGLHFQYGWGAAVEAADVDLSAIGDHTGQAVDTAADAGDPQVHSVEQQLARELAQRRPAGRAGAGQKRRHVIKAHVAQIGADAEFAVHRVVVKRHVVHLAAHAKVDPVGRTAAHRIFHITPDLWRDAQWQVTVHLGGVGAVEAGVEVERSRKAVFAAGASGGVPMGVALAFCVGVGGGHLIGPHVDALSLGGPAQAAVESLQRQAAVFKHAGQVQHAVAHAQLGLAALVVRHKTQTGARDTGSPRHRKRAIGADLAAGLGRERQATQFAFDPVAAAPPRCVGLRRGGPFAADALHHTGGLQALQGAQGQGANGQALGQVRQTAQINVAGVQRHLLQRAAVVEHHTPVPAAGGPRGFLVHLQGQAVGLHAPARLGALQPQRPLQTAQAQRLQPLAQSHVHVAQPQPGLHRFGQALAQLGLQHQRAHPCAPVHAPAPAVQMVAQVLNIDGREFGHDLPLPAQPHRLLGLLPGQERVAQFGAQGKGLAPFGGGHGVDLPVVPAAAVAQLNLHVAQGQRGGAAQFVGPAHGASADHQFALRQQPFGHPGVACGVGGHVLPRHLDAPVGQAAHLQFGPVDHQLFKAPSPQRRQGHRQLHMRQAQGHLALFVQQAHVTGGQGWRGGQPVGQGGRQGAQFADLHRLPQRL